MKITHKNSPRPYFSIFFPQLFGETPRKRRGGSEATGAALGDAGPSEARTQGVGIAALFRRLRTQNRAVSGAASVAVVVAGTLLLASPALANDPIYSFATLPPTPKPAPTPTSPSPLTSATARTARSTPAAAVTPKKSPSISPPA